MSIEKIERELREKIGLFADWPPDTQLTGFPCLMDLLTIENIRAILDELSRLREALVDVRVELIHGEGDAYERITTCKGIVERVLSEREGHE